MTAPAEPTGAREDAGAILARLEAADDFCTINPVGCPGHVSEPRDWCLFCKLATAKAEAVMFAEKVLDTRLQRDEALSALATARQERDAALKREESTTMHRDVVDQHRCDLERIAQQQTGMITSLRARIAELEREGKAWRDQGTDDGAVYFYERDFYVLSNFSAFTLKLGRFTYPTSEHAYQAQKFIGVAHGVWESIAFAPSAHIAFKIAEQYASLRRPDWNDVKINVMRDILGAKADQHEYVRRKLIQSGTRTLIENSWRDDFWGWGADGQGQNMLGKLWMALRSSLATPPADGDSK